MEKKEKEKKKDGRKKLQRSGEERRVNLEYLKNG